MISRIYTHSTGTTLEYNLYGSGSKFLICFHGFNETPKHFSFLERDLDQHSILSISLFYHGHSKRSTPSYLSIKEWSPVIDGLLKELKIDRFSIISYSMGGRFAISTFQCFNDRIDNLVLIAPDGIIRRFWYELATFPVGLDRLFRFFMQHPSPFLKFIKILQSLRLINDKTLKFAMSQLKTKEQRMLVYNCWTAFKYFTINTSKLSELINVSKVNCVFIFGQHDTVIQYKHHKRFLQSVNLAQIHVLECSHQKLVPSSLEIIKNTLNQRA